MAETVTVRSATLADAETWLSLVDALADYEKLARPTPEARQRLVHDAFGPAPNRIQVYMAEVGGQAVGYAIMLGFMGLIMPGIDNYAHAGGFVGGYLAGRVMDPLHPERLDHLLIALGCLAASALAIFASMVTGLPAIR